MIRPFFAVVKKEIGSVLRDRTIIIAVLIQLFIASFSSSLLLGMLSLYDADTIMRFSGEGIHLGVVGEGDHRVGPAVLGHRGHAVGFGQPVELVGLREPAVVAGLGQGFGQHVGFERPAVREPLTAVADDPDAGAVGAGGGEGLDLAAEHLHRRRRRPTDRDLDLLAGRRAVDQRSGQGDQIGVAAAHVPDMVTSDTANETPVASHGK